MGHSDGPLRHQGPGSKTGNFYQVKNDDIKDKGKKRGPLEITGFPGRQDVIQGMRGCSQAKGQEEKEEMMK
jgi:hypothetical protein